ncbi:ATP-binding protein [Dehalococcoidia bacterium]|nr:ATP-binding protein [Dehalococcoidia bacterium]
MIKFLKVRNFRSIGDKEVNLDLKPLTILVGPSGSGKSNLLYFIDWLYVKTQEGPQVDRLDSEIIEIFGVESFEELIHACKWENELEFLVKIQTSETGMQMLKTRADWVNWELLGLKKPHTGILGYELKCRRMEDGPRFPVFHKELIVGDSSIIALSQEYNPRTHITEYFSTIPPKLGYKMQISQSCDILTRSNFAFSYEDTNLKEQREGLSVFMDFCQECMEVIRRRFSRVYLLTTLRGGIKRSTRPSAKDKVGRCGEAILEVLGDILASDRIGRIEKTNDLMFWCSNFGFRDIVAGLVKGKDIISSRYTDEWSGLELSLPSASYGCRQVLTIIAQLIAAETESIILIEEPELSLHPRYQALLPLFFADAIKNRGHQIIITTHSSFVVLALSRAVQGYKLRGQTLKGEEEREFKMDIGDIAVYHITREKGFTEAERLELSTKGFVKDGIPSFVDVERKLLGEIL